MPPEFARTLRRRAMPARPRFPGRRPTGRTSGTGTGDGEGDDVTTAASAEVVRQILVSASPIGPAGPHTTAGLAGTSRPTQGGVGHPVDAVMQLLAATDPDDRTLWKRLSGPLSELINSLYQQAGGDARAAAATDPPVLLLRQFVHALRLERTAEARRRDGADRPAGGNAD